MCKHELLYPDTPLPYHSPKLRNNHISLLIPTNFILSILILLSFLQILPFHFAITSQLSLPDNVLFFFSCLHNFVHIVFLSFRQIILTFNLLFLANLSLLLYFKTLCNFHFERMAGFHQFTETFFKKLTFTVLTFKPASVPSLPLTQTTSWLFSLS